MDDVVQVTPEEEKIYHKIDFDVKDYCQTLGAKKLVHHEDKVFSLIALPTIRILKMKIQKYTYK